MRQVLQSDIFLTASNRGLRNVFVVVGVVTFPTSCIESSLNGVIVGPFLKSGLKIRPVFHHSVVVCPQFSNFSLPS